MGEMVGLEEGPRDWVVGGRRWWWVVVVGGGGCWWVVVGGEVFHLFRWSTHTPRCREAVFCNCGAVSEALIWALRQDAAIDAKSKYREEICI